MWTAIIKKNKERLREALTKEIEANPISDRVKSELLRELARKYERRYMTRYAKIREIGLEAVEKELTNDQKD